ncbi:MAG: glycerol-3-phosphate dehydrogenase, partial [Candidatus Eremiobacteraeota bacterium]|nr:glycerol-3-phosphate dehydrogenase [Candidatus Eremiobacteraeota bacterium]
HLAHNYGDRALAVADLAKEGLGERLAPNHPYLEAEVVYACKHEYATTPVDVLSRRTRLSFIDEKATVAALPRTVDLMAETLGWSDEQKAKELEQAQAFYARNNLA